MAIDLSLSRRDCNEFCRCWIRDEREKYTSEELVFKRSPDITFWAKEVSPEQLRNNIIGGSFMFDSTHVTIRTPDNCYRLQNEHIKNECFVEYQQEKWIVVSVQKSQARKGNSMFAYDRDCSHYWYIELRK